MLARARARPRVFTRLRNGSFRETLPLRHGADGEIWLHEASAYRHPRHRHAELELNLALAGRAAYLVGDRIVDLPRNGLLWLFPEDDHAHGSVVMIPEGSSRAYERYVAYPGMPPYPIEPPARSTGC